MRDRVVFFLLVAIVATVAYFVGDMEKVDAQDNSRIFDNVVIKGELVITGGKLVVEDNENLNNRNANTFGVIVSDGHVLVTIDNHKGAIRAGEPSSEIIIAALEDEEVGSAAYMFIVSDSGKSEKLITSLDRK